MTIKKLDRADWAAYFDRMSKNLGGKKVTIEVAALEIGHQVEAKSLPLSGLVYDRKSKLFEVQTEQLDHLIHEPMEIFVEESFSGVTSVEVLDGDGAKQIIRLTEPLLIEDHPSPEIIAEARARLTEIVSDIRTERDELRVRLHLLKKEVGDEWEATEGKWRSLEPKLVELRKSAAGAKDEIGATCGRLAVEIKRAYQKLRDATH